MHPLRNCLSTALVWALVPFFVVSGIPRIGCICADGQHKLFCGRQLAQSCCQDGQAVSDSCPCCHKSESAQSSDRAPRSNCCGRKAEKPAGATVSKTCCTRYLVNPIVPRVAEIVSAPVPLPEWVVLEFVPNPVMNSVATLAREMLRSLDLPVPDLLIAHQVFVI